MLFERGLALSARLARIRRDVVEGRIVRGIAHGHPYWSESLKAQEWELDCGSIRTVLQ